MRVVVMGRDIGAALRIERRLNGDHLCAKSVRHIFDDVIATNAQRAAGQFDRQMAIAEMPGDASERDRVLATDFGQRLWSGDDFDDASILERQPIAGPQHHRLRQIEKKFEAANPCHRQAAAIPVVVIQDDGIGWRAGPRAGRVN
jgi:hypothetical protein